MLSHIARANLEECSGYDGLAGPGEAPYKCYDKKLATHSALVPCLRTMAMGDNNAVSYGQVAHLSVILRSESVNLDEFLTLKSPPPRSSLTCGLMIDDFLLVEKVKAGCPDDQVTRADEVIASVRRS